jgi:two-component system nitrate/nitrite response regulator NarL
MDEGRDQIRIVIVSTVRLYREGLNRILNDQPGIQVAGVFRDLTGLLTEVPAAGVAIIESEGIKDVSQVRRIREILPAMRLIALAVDSTDDDLVRIAGMGVDGIVHRDATVQDLVAVIRGGLAACPGKLTEALFRHVASGRSVHTSSRLTDREHEIVALIDAGLSNKQIAQRLSLKPATVKNHIHNVLTKLGVSRRGAAAAYFRHHRMV